MCSNGLFVPMKGITGLVDDFIATTPGDDAAATLSHGYIALHMRRGDFCIRTSKYRRRGACLDPNRVADNIKKLLTEMSLSVVYILSDDEAAMTQAFRHAFKSTPQFRCLFFADIPKRLFAVHDRAAGARLRRQPGVVLQLLDLRHALELLQSQRW
jgi:hypothetical protein